MATVPDRLRLSTDKPKTDELLLAVNGALREISAAIKAVESKPAALSPAPVVVSIPGKDGKDGRDGRDGVDGEDGAQGPEGPPGGGTIVHHQDLPMAVWRYQHNLDMYPDFEATDASLEVVEGDKSYPDRNTVQIAFSVPFPGLLIIHY